jgi:hypothetical protein
MSKKVTGKDLQKLIEGVLSENKIRIPNSAKKNVTGNGLYKKDALEDQGYIYEPVKNHRKVSKVKDLAAIDGEDTSISIADLEKGIENGNEYAEPWLDSILKGSNRNKNSFKAVKVGLSQASLSKGLSKSNQGYANFAAVIYNYLVNDADATSAAEVLRDLQSLINSGVPAFKNVSPTSMKAVVDAVRGFTQDQGEEVKAPLERLSSEINAGIERDEREYTDVAGSLDISSFEAEPGIDSTATSFGGKSIHVDSALMSQFDVFDLSNGLVGFFDQIVDVAERIRDENFPTAAEAAFEFVIKANVVNRLANLSKMYDYSSGGFELEKLLAFALGGAKIGGDGGAADVLAQLQSNDVVHTSQKLVSENYSKQSYSNTQTLLKAGKKLFYTFFEKEGGADTKIEFNSIKLYICSIYTTDESNPIVDPSGENTNIFIADLLPNKGFSAARALTMFDANSLKIGPKNAYTTIPLVDSATADPAKVANYISSQIVGDESGGFKSMAKAIIDSFKILRNMERNTQEYNAVRAKPDAGKGLDPQVYVNELAEDYVEMRKNYKKIFKPTESSKAVARTTTETPFTESKKVTPSFLKKLIQEKFKK